MADSNQRSDSTEITAGADRALARKSTALVSRGLGDLSARDIATFVELGKALTSTLQLDQVLRVIMQKLDEFFHADNWYLLLLDESRQELYFELVVGKESSELRDRRIKLGEGIAGWAAANSELVLAVHAQQDPRFKESVDGWPDLETRSIVAVPLSVQGRCLGVIGLINVVGSDGFRHSDISLLQAFADFSAIALENARHVKAIHHLTITDDSTGLYNARHLAVILETEIDRSERYGYEFSLLFVEIDGLIDLNKLLSYKDSAQARKEVGEAFKQQLRLIDFAFCYRDGEFVLVLPQTTKSSGRLIASHLHKFFKEASWLHDAGQSLYLPARVAVGTFPEDGKTKVDLLHAVDEAMCLLKQSSTDGIAVANVGVVASD